MFDANWFAMFCLFLPALAFVVPTVVEHLAANNMDCEDENRKRGGRKPSPSRGLPDEASLRELAQTYLTKQRELWPELNDVDVLPNICEDAISSLASSFKNHFLDRGWQPLNFGLSKERKLGAAYLRFSSDNSNPRSLHQQLANCLIRAQQDSVFIPWVYIFADAAVSGTIAQRRGYQMSKTLITSSLYNITTLYFDELGRTGRYTIEALRLGQLVQKANKRMIGVTDGFDSDSVHSKMQLSLFAMLHEWFVDQLREKVNRGMNDAFERGIDIAGAAFGYKMVAALNEDGSPVIKHNGKPQRVRVVNQEEATYVIEAFVSFAEERKSPQAISKAWNDRQVGGRTAWAPNTIVDLIERETYVGFEFRNKTRQFRDPETGKHTVIERPRSEWKRREVPHLQIVERGLWERAQERLAECRAGFALKHPKGGRANIYPKTLIRPICGCCNKELVLGHAGKNPSFCCINGRNHAHGCHFVGYKMVSIVESAILAAISNRIFTAEFEERLLEAANQKLLYLARQPKLDIKPIRDEIKKLKRRREKLADVIETAGKRSVATLVARLQRCEQQLDQRRQEFKAVNTEAIGEVVPLQLSDIQRALANIRELLNAEKPIAAPIVKALTGPIVVEQVAVDGKKRPVWLAKFELNAVPVLAELSKKVKSPTARTLEILAFRHWTFSIPLLIPLVRPTRYEQLGPQIKQAFDSGEDLDEIAKRHKISRKLATMILEFAVTGARPSWNGRRLRIHGPEEENLKYVRFAQVVAELHEQEGLPLSHIPGVLRTKYNESVSETTVTSAYQYAIWARKAGLPLPNGQCT